MYKVGNSLPRKDAIGKATGKELFIDDKKFPGMLYGYTFRSPKPYIKIKKLITRQAESISGVHKIVTYKDIPGKNQIPSPKKIA